MLCPVPPAAGPPDAGPPDVPPAPDRTGPLLCAAGCRARPAEFGVLCRRCHGRLMRVLAHLPDVVLHLEADDLHRALVSWVRDALELCPAGVVRPARLGLVRGDRYGVGDASHSLCAWLGRHLVWVESQAWSARLVDELDALFLSALLRGSRTRCAGSAPWAELRGYRLDDAACPTCGGESLRRFPPSTYRTSTVVQCTREDCLHVVASGGPAGSDG